MAAKTKWFVGAGVTVPVVVSIIFKDFIAKYISPPCMEFIGTRIFSVTSSHDAAALKQLDGTVNAFDINAVGAILIIAGVVGVYIIIDKIKSRSKMLEIKERISNAERITGICGDFVRNIDYIEGVQIYEYTCRRRRDKEYITLNYLYGSVDHDVNLNAIIQERFELPRDIYEEITRFAKECNEAYAHGQCIPGETRARGITLKAKIENRLMTVDINSITEEDCCLYRVLRMIHDDIVHDNTYAIFPTAHQDLEDALVQKKRTGILPSTFMNNARLFRNNANRFKKNRVYFTFKIDVDPNKKRMVALFAADGSIMDHDLDGVSYEINERFRKLISPRSSGSQVSNPTSVEA